MHQLLSELSSTELGEWEVMYGLIWPEQEEAAKHNTNHSNRSAPDPMKGRQTFGR